VILSVSLAADAGRDPEQVGSVSCDICECRTRSRFRKNGFRILECRRCGYAFAHPRIAARDVAALYQNLDPAARSPDQHARYAKYVGDEEEPRRVYRALGRLGISFGRVLDVGAGLGKYTAFFQAKKFEVLPLEVDPFCIRRIQERTGLIAAAEPFEDWNPRSARYDVILMSQVLEHCRDPRLWLRKAHSLLRPNGILFVGVPNFDSLLVAILGARDGHICPPSHLNYFSRKCLSILAQQEGLRIERCFDWSYVTFTFCCDIMATRLFRLTAARWLGGTALYAFFRAADAVHRGRYLYAFLRRDENGV